MTEPRPGTTLPVLAEERVTDLVGVGLVGTLNRLGPDHTRKIIEYQALIRAYKATDPESNGPIKDVIKNHDVHKALRENNNGA